ncbi:hypothetical protein MAR_009211 [Mya arenaria]|uniref:Uncharacterized protein n=1 Tax=Mya arenaria TaxID=6604 RepID=A0ABY7DY36_MYAAR|nr:hypothetical protein MAR_009211 [Mya arenaria]
MKDRIFGCKQINTCYLITYLKQSQQVYRLQAKLANIESIRGQMHTFKEVSKLIIELAPDSQHDCIIVFKLGNLDKNARHCTLFLSQYNMLWGEN